MSTLERRCRLLLTAYPAEYRRERGEEIIGTLLETTPQGRSWPLARDFGALIIGGLRVRAAANRRLSTAADIRLGALLGLAMQLSVFAAGRLLLFVTSSAVFGTARETAASGWRELVAGLLLAAAVMCAWRGRRRLLVACAPVAAAVVIWLLIHEPYDSAGYTDWTLMAGETGGILLCLAALMLLVRQTERPSRSWLWLIGLIVATGVLPGLVPGHLRVVLWWPSPLLPLIVLIVSIVWIAIDARPALGLATYLALEVVTIFGDTVRLGNAAVLYRAEAWWYVYAIPLYVGGLALWRLRRRQAVH